MKANKNKSYLEVLVFFIFIFLGLILIILLESKIQSFQLKKERIQTVQKANSVPKSKVKLADFKNIEYFDIKIDDSDISPKKIEAKKDSKIVLNVRVFEGYHNLQVEGYQIKTKRIPTNKFIKLEFVATQSGVFMLFSKTGMYKNEPKNSILIIN